MQLPTVLPTLSVSGFVDLWLEAKSVALGPQSAKQEDSRWKEGNVMFCWTYFLLNYAIRSVPDVERYVDGRSEAKAHISSSAAAYAGLLGVSSHLKVGVPDLSEFGVKRYIRKFQVRTNFRAALDVMERSDFFRKLTGSSAPDSLARHSTGYSDRGKRTTLLFKRPVLDRVEFVHRPRDADTVDKFLCYVGDNVEIYSTVLKHFIKTARLAEQAVSRYSRSQLKKMSPSEFHRITDYVDETIPNATPTTVADTTSREVGATPDRAIEPTLFPAMRFKLGVRCFFEPKGSVSP